MRLFHFQCAHRLLCLCLLLFRRVPSLRHPVLARRNVHCADTIITILYFRTVLLSATYVCVVYIVHCYPRYSMCACCTLYLVIAITIHILYVRTHYFTAPLARALSAAVGDSIRAVNRDRV